MHLRKIFSVLILVTLSLNLHAQNPELDPELEEIDRQAHEILTENETLDEVKRSGLVFNDTETDWDIIKSIPRDAWELIKAPAGWDKKEWIIASGVVTMTGLIMTQDKRVKEFVQANKTEFTKDVSHFAEMGGSQAPIALGATYLVGTILKNPKLKKASVVAFTSYLITGALTQGLKMMFARERPYRSEDPMNFHGPGKFSLEHRSFPSGHTSGAFAVAASIATVYDSKLVKILAYSAATLTGLSRIHDNKHWAADVFMGAALGTAAGIFITKRHMNAGKNSVQVTPSPIYLDNGTQGYGVSVRIPIATGKNKRKRLP